ncbi:MAG: hypothetical protein R3276_14055 [Marinobacter sp.]|nr:hypothetical protein [Marinobacter sp.]
MTGISLRALWLVGSLLAWQSVSAQEVPSGTRTIYLLTSSGEEQPVGTVEFEPGADGKTQYRIDMDMQRFKDFFLSMKEMKCLEGPDIWCFIPYPYDHPRTVTADDLRWLEHDLLFMYKRPDEYGANLWNGIYYDMSVDGSVIRGKAGAVDLNQLAAPPDDLTVPPYGEYDVGELEVSQRWLPVVEIR